jgi:hypothetical protein
VRSTHIPAITESTYHVLVAFISFDGRVPSSSFQYLTPRIQITPCDLTDTPLFRPTTLHFICSPTRAAVIMSQVAQVESWSPVTIYEPIPVRSSIQSPPVPPCRRKFRIHAFRRSYPRSAMFCHSFLCSGAESLGPSVLLYQNTHFDHLPDHTALMLRKLSGFSRSHCHRRSR